MPASTTMRAAALGVVTLAVAVLAFGAGPTAAARESSQAVAPKWITLDCAGVRCSLKVASPTGGYFWVSFGGPPGTAVRSVRPSLTPEGGCNRAVFGRIGPNGFVCLAAHKGQGFNFPDGPSFDLEPGKEWKPVEPGTAWVFDFTVDKALAATQSSSMCLWAMVFSEESCYSIRPANAPERADEDGKYDLAVTITPSRSSARAGGGHYSFETGIQVRNRESARRDSEATKLELHVSASTGVLRSRLAITGPRAKCDASVCFLPQIKPGLASVGAAPAKAELQAIRGRLKTLLSNTKWWKNTAGELAALVGLGSAVAPELAPGAAAAGFIGVRLDRLGDDIDEEIDKLDDAIGESAATPSRKTEAARATLPRIVPGGDLTPQAATALNKWAVAAVASGVAIDRFTSALGHKRGSAAAQAKAATAVAVALDRMDAASAGVAAAGVRAVGLAEIADAQAGVVRDGISPRMLTMLRGLGVTNEDVERLKTIVALPLRAGFPAAISGSRARADVKRVADGFRRFAAN